MQRNPLVNNNNTQMDRRDNRSGKRSSTNMNVTVHVAAPVPTLTPAQKSSNFEEWIKMCTDNKVNVTNTWGFALIDYFHEMTFIREGDSINFQKASCTLDGCVKIYTSRVDSVANETGKLLSGLADSSNADGDDESRQGGGERRVRKKTNRSEVTLLKDFTTIAVKKFELDFAVDPLFKKTSADFDEGGARGLLLNHLGTDQNCKIIFDASDATIEGETEELDIDEPTVEEDEEQEDKPVDDPIDVSDDKASTDELYNSEKDNDDATKDIDSMDIDEFNKENSPVAEDDELPPTIDDIPTADKPIENSPIAEESIESSPAAPESSQESRVEVSRLKGRLPILDSFSDLNLVSTLKGFDFFTENDVEIPNLDHDDDDSPPFEENPLDDHNNQFHFDDYDMDYGGMDDDMDPFAIDETNNDNNDDEEEDHQLDNTEKNYPEQDFLTALMNNGEQELFNYFDTTLNHNWAGPEHWKLRRAPPPLTDKTNQDDADKPKRKAKVEFQIQFDEEENDEDEEALFEPVSKGRLTMTNEAMSKMTKHLLPDDIHFSSKQLLQYFLKPMFPSDPKKKKANNAAAQPQVPADNGSEEPDVNFWAEQNTQDYCDDMYYGDMPTDTFDPADNTILTAFEDTSFYQDNYDDPEVSVLYGDPLITNHHLKKVKPLYVNYARTAKRVDVKKLKDNLWKALTLAKGGPEDNNREEEKVHGVQRFTDIVNSLKRMYSPKTMRDISVPFCFICLLHLANEKDLSIMGVDTPDEDDFVLGEGDWMNNENILNEVTIVQNA